jgi:hypothetical protein
MMYAYPKMRGCGNVWMRRCGGLGACGEREGYVRRAAAPRLAQGLPRA